MASTRQEVGAVRDRESLNQLLRQSHHARPEDLAEMAMQAASLLGATEIIIYLVDHQQRQLLPLLAGSAPSREPLGIDGTLAGRAFSMATTCIVDGAGNGVRLWLPLLDGSERMGVLEVVAETPLDDEVIDECAAVASLLAEMVVTRSLYSDTIERVRRCEPMQLAAEIDGITEARSPTAEVFGAERLIELAVKAMADQLPLPETARRLVHAILHHQDNHLQDDATVLLAHWRAAAPHRSDASPVTAPAHDPLNP
jgi:hypothetical protein